MTANRMICFLMQINKKLLLLNDGKPYDFSHDAHLDHSDVVRLFHFDPKIRKSRPKMSQKTSQKRHFDPKYGNPVRKCPKKRPKNVKNLIKI